jgi:fission process protein 1
MSASVDNTKQVHDLSVPATNSGERRKSFSQEVAQGEVDSVDTNARWLAYGARLRTAIRASSRYLAYSSDVGEAFRPIVHPLLVRAAYGVSWAYVGLDVAYEGYKARKAGHVSISL